MSGDAPAAWKLIVVVAGAVALVILVFFAVGYLLGRALL